MTLNFNQAPRIATRVPRVGTRATIGYTIDAKAPETRKLRRSRERYAQTDDQREKELFASHKIYHVRESYRFC